MKVVAIPELGTIVMTILVIGIVVITKKTRLTAIPGL
jgi:hypothetical protein